MTHELTSADRANFDSLSNRDLERFFPGDSELAARMRALDWSQTDLGSPQTWSESLRVAVSLCVTSRIPIVMYWGTNFTVLYNDAYISFLGETKHPRYLGQPGQECWQEIWDTIGPMLKSVYATGNATLSEDVRMFFARRLPLEEVYVRFTFGPILASDGKTVQGIFCPCTETTEQVVSARRLETLRKLGLRSSEVQTVEAVCQEAARVISENPSDIPFAAIYLVDETGKRARMSASVGFSEDGYQLPLEISTKDDLPALPIASVLHTHTAQRIELGTLAEQLPKGLWSEPAREAIALAIPAAASDSPAGVLLVGVSSRRVLDDAYRTFFDLVTGHIGTVIADARAYEEERKRAEALAEIDRAKTVFFSNISHEFRTPLTLMLGPLEDALTSVKEWGSGGVEEWRSGGAKDDPSTLKEQLQLAQRNGTRLLKLVNTLLDFSRIEAGRVEASYEPTDLAAYTAELASVFRSAIERSGMHLVVDCPPLPELVYIDREMWEKIVLNLLSNAFKFTFTGEIRVSLRWGDGGGGEAGGVGGVGEGREAREVKPTTSPSSPSSPSTHPHVVLQVHDTGIGIPAAELPHLFERFHRVKEAQGRSIEGSGIGLSLVQELVKLHQGTIAVASVEGEGTCFTIAIPTGTAHLPHDRINVARTLSSALRANSYVEEALRWLPEEGNREWGVGNREELTPTPYSLLPTPHAARVLVADDNADMRDYVKRLLSQQYEVEAVSDGAAALAVARQRVPDLVLTDVMMPRLDGFGLLQALRSTPQTRDIPIILLSARAGEEARVEGLAAGADDYLTKPFSARELMARVEASLKLAQLRRETETIRARLESVLAGIKDQFIVLDQDWRYTFVNDQVIAVTGKTKEELLGHCIWDVFPETINSPFDVAVRRAIAEQTFVQVEVFYPPFEQWFENRIYPFTEGVIIFVTDISDRKRIENERKQAEAEREELLVREQTAREQAEQANRIKDEFLAVLSHELRSPLNPILGWAKLLQGGKLDETKTAQALATIERNAKLQSELIEDLLDVSRILQGKLSLNVAPVNLASTIRGAMETVRLAAEAKSIQVKTNLAEDVGLVLGDATRLQQIVWNLLSNAVKFTPPGGQITICLECLDSSAQITVSDTGQGIAPDFLPHVFDYFRQADGATTRKFGGLGLGLAIVRHLVELHGGTVRADSFGEGQGATFTIRLPLLHTSSLANQDDRSSQQSLDLSDIKILVVDDEPDTRDLVAFVLEQQGAQVITATSAYEALLMLPQAKPDVLLSDIGMPEMDGYMLIQQVRALAPEQGGQIPAIALTAYAGDTNQQQVLAAGFQKHISKPIEPEELVQAIVGLVRST
jgi:PAS domain S-box-containing protein